jgi:SpoVK/Ycf46/Vps4 family AAA+-type ATPase
MNLTEKKKNLIVIIAGYTDQLEESFFSVNEGLKRRFPFRFTIEGYDEKELTQIFYNQIKKLQWNLDEELSKEYLEQFFKTNKKDINNFGGDIETIIMNCKMTHAKRVIGKPVLKKIINIADFTKAFDNFKTNKNKQKELNESVKQMYL